MKFPIIIKQSPLILVKRIIGVEIAVGFTLFVLSYLGNYQELYLSSPFGNVFRYDIFLVLGASLLQLLVTLLTFFQWANEEYRLKEKEILHRTGLVFARERSILLKNVSLVEHKKGVFEFLFGYGTIFLSNASGNKHEGFKIESVETPEIYANLIKDAIDQALEQKTISHKKVSILDLVLEGEHSHLELKQTFRYDGKAKDVSKVLEKAVMKTIAAFLNADGGCLVVGVTDNGRIYGLEDDYNTLVRKDRDGFENHFNLILKQMMGAEFRQYVSLSFERIENKDVCLIEVSPSSKPVYLRANGTEEFFIRTGNTTSQLKISEVNSYIESHWKK